MIQLNTVLTVADNSGAKKLHVIGIPGHSNKMIASIGDTVRAAVIGASSQGVVADHSVVSVVIVRTAKEFRRKDGSHIRFDDNAGVIINKDKSMVGTRVFGPVAREIRDKGYLKIASLAKEVW